MSTAGISFTVLTAPQGQPRARQGRGKWYQPITLFYEACQWAARAMRPRAPYEGPLRVDITFVMPRPKSAPSWKRWHTATPDRDNLDKAVLDAMKKAGWFKDDAQVCAGQIIKRLARAVGEEPHAHIEVARLTEGDI